MTRVVEQEQKPEKESESLMSDTAELEEAEIEDEGPDALEDDDSIDKDETDEAEVEPVTFKAGEVSSKDLDATRLYLKEIEFSPLLTPEEEVYYARLARKGDERGRKRMIECNLRLVVKIARRYMNRGLPLLDLIEEGRSRVVI